jgi:hypothetical protein
LIDHAFPSVPRPRQSRVMDAGLRCLSPRLLWLDWQCQSALRASDRFPRSDGRADQRR